MNNQKLSQYLCCVCLLIGSAHAGDRQRLEVSFGPVGTPDFIGPNRVADPEFTPPVAEQVVMPENSACLLELHGTYEAHLGANGQLSELKSLKDPVNGTACERNLLFPALQAWRFRAARYQDQPTAVYLRYWLNSGYVQAQ